MTGEDRLVKYYLLIYTWIFCHSLLDEIGTSGESNGKCAVDNSFVKTKDDSKFYCSRHFLSKTKMRQSDMNIFLAKQMTANNSVDINIYSKRQKKNELRLNFRYFFQSIPSFAWHLR